MRLKGPRRGKLARRIAQPTNKTHLGCSIDDFFVEDRLNIENTIDDLWPSFAVKQTVPCTRMGDTVSVNAYATDTEDIADMVLIHVYEILLEERAPGKGYLAGLSGAITTSRKQNTEHIASARVHSCCIGKPPTHKQTVDGKLHQFRAHLHITKSTLGGVPHRSTHAP